MDLRLDVACAGNSSLTHLMMLRAARSRETSKIACSNLDSSLDVLYIFLLIALSACIRHRPTNIINTTVV